MTAALVARLREVADVLERLDAQAPLPDLYVTAWSYGDGLTTADVQVTKRLDDAGDPDALDDLDERIAVVEVLRAAGLRAYTRDYWTTDTKAVSA